MSRSDIPAKDPRLAPLIRKYVATHGVKALLKLLQDDIYAKSNRRHINLLQKEIDILHTLYRLDFMTSEQIKNIFFPNHTSSGSWHHLKKLSKHRLILKESIYESRTKHWILWKLSNLGIKYVMDSLGYKGEYNIPSMMPIKGTQLNHDISVNQIFVDLVRLFKDPDIMLNQINWHPHHRRFLKYKPTKKYSPKRKKYYTHYSMIYPDIMFKSNISSFKVYLEFDTGTKNISDIAQDLKNYADYFKESEEQYDYVVFLVYAVHNQNRREKILNIVEEIGGDSTFANFRTYIHSPELIEKLKLMITGRKNGKES